MIIRKITRDLNIFEHLIVGFHPILKRKQEEKRIGFSELWQDD